VLIDTHCHLYFAHFDDDRREVLERMHDASIAKAIVIGIDAKSNAQSYDLASTHDELLYTVGFHPASSIPKPLDIEQLLSSWWQRPIPPVAIGECGLDLHHNDNPLSVQIEVFTTQLQYATEHNLPVVVHSRDADEETRKALQTVPQTRGVLHCFNGSQLLLEFALANGWYISFAGNVTYPKAVALREAATQVPPERLLVETDAPFLAPQPVRGQRAEPAHIVHTAEVLAQLQDLTQAELAHVTTENAQRLFDFSLAE